MEIKMSLIIGENCWYGTAGTAIKKKGKESSFFIAHWYDTDGWSWLFTNNILHLDNNDDGKQNDENNNANR